jgi:hypothetical protein
MSRTFIHAAFAAAVFSPTASQADVLPVTSTYGYSYVSDGTAFIPRDAYYQTGNGGQIVDRSQSAVWGSTGFGARADRVGNQVVLGAKASSSGAPTEQTTYVGAKSTYSADVTFTAPTGRNISIAPTTANFQFALHGRLLGGPNAVFSLFNGASGVYGSGVAGDLQSTSDVSHNLHYVADANGGYDVDGVVNFPVSLTAGNHGAFSGLLNLSMTAAASSISGLAAMADFMNTAKIVGITFPEHGDRSASEIGFNLDFSALPVDFVDDTGRGPFAGPGANGQQSPVPEPASLVIWVGAAAGLAVFKRKRSAS